MVRPVKYNRARHEDICRSLEAGMSRTTAAELAGIHRETLENWCGRYPTFSSAVQEAIAKAKARATVTITKAIRDGDVSAAFRYLALRERDEWAERRSVEVNVTLRTLAEQFAQETGLNADEIIAEAEAITRRAQVGTAE